MFVACEQTTTSHSGDCFGKPVVVPDILPHVSIRSIAVAVADSLQNVRFGTKSRPSHPGAIAALAQSTMSTMSTCTLPTLPFEVAKP
jgi:hypothetical protein